MTDVIVSDVTDKTVKFVFMGTFVLKLSINDSRHHFFKLLLVNSFLTIFIETRHVTIFEWTRRCQ